MKRFGWTTLVLLSLVAPLASGCVRTDEGVAIRSEDAATTTVGVRNATQSTEDAGPAAPGIVTTSRAPIPRGHRQLSAAGQAGRDGRRTGI